MNRSSEPNENLAATFEAWLRGELEPEAERAFLAAAERDAVLREEVAAYRSLIGDLRALPAEVNPERDLWPALERRVNPQVATRRWRATSLALAASLLAVIGVALLWRAPSNPLPEPPAPPSRPAPVIAASALAGSAFAETDLALTAIRQELRREIDSRQGQLPPETRQLVFDNLETIERAIAEIEAALALRPANPELARTYIAYRQRQIALLRQVNLTAARL